MLYKNVLLDLAEEIMQFIVSYNTTDLVDAFNTKCREIRGPINTKMAMTNERNSK